MGHRLRTAPAAPDDSVASPPSTEQPFTVGDRQVVVGPPDHHCYDGQLIEAINKIVGKADANSAIKAGQFQEFEVSLGPLPKTDHGVALGVAGLIAGLLAYRRAAEPAT